MKETKKTNIVLCVYILVFIICTLSSLGPSDCATWIMEVAPAYLGLIAIFILYARGVHLSNLLNIVIPVHMLILIIGGFYTYSKVPFFNVDDCLGETLGWTRNNYDKLGHFMQGFTPFLAMKELLIKKNVVRKGFMLVFLCVSVSLAISAVYELIEYTSSVMLGSGADDFIGAQGDFWDTQKDILWAFIGAVAAAVLFMKYRYKNN